MATKKSKIKESIVSMYEPGTQREAKSVYLSQN
jgi:hypothetical protein